MIRVDSITTRPLLPADEEFSYQVYASTRAEEMQLVDWSPEQKEAFLRMQFNAQTTYYRASYPHAEYLVIQQGETPIGRLIVDRSQDPLLLMDIALLPEYRSAGIGSAIIRDLQSENRRISLHVLKSNPALNLYRRLGFVFRSEDAIYMEMEWMPEVKA